MRRVFFAPVRNVGCSRWTLCDPRERDRAARAGGRARSAVAGRCSAAAAFHLRITLAHEVGLPHATHAAGRSPLRAAIVMTFATPGGESAPFVWPDLHENRIPLSAAH